MTLIEESFTLRRGQLVLTRGRHETRRTLLHILDIRDLSVMAIPLLFRCAHPRHVQFADKQQVTDTETRSIVQDFSANAEVEQASSSETIG